jgi:hypothetical protein
VCRGWRDGPPKKQLAAAYFSGRIRSHIKMLAG